MKYQLTLVLGKPQRTKPRFVKRFSVVYPKYVWVFVVIVLLTACADPDLVCDDVLGCVTVRPNDPIRIGYLLANSGTAAFLGEDSQGGIEIAIDDRAIGVLDHQIELVGEDTGCDTDKGRTAVQTLTQDPSVVGIIGSNCSGVAEVIMPIVNEAGMIMLSPSNTAPDLTVNRSWRGAYVRTAHSYLLSANVAAMFAYEEMGGRTAVILHDDSEYSNRLAQTFAAAWHGLGGRILAESELAVGQTNLDVTTLLAINPPDILYMPLFEPEGSIVVNTVVGVPGLEDIVFLGAENLLVPHFAQSVGAAAAGMFLAGTAVSGSEYDIFLAKWDVKFGGIPPSTYHAHAYDATNILLDAIETSAQKSTDGTLLIGRQALRQTIASTTNFDGLTGTLSCDEAGDCASGEALGIYQITVDEIAGDYWPPPLIWQPSR